MTHPIQKTDAEWQAVLREKGAEPVAFQVTRHAATERPFTGKYADEATLFRLAGQLEKEMPWKDKRPPVWN